MEYRYPVAKPCLSGKELEYITNAIKTGWISSLGSYVTEFENSFASWNNMKHGVACSSGTSALILALRALNIGHGDEVIVPEFTMIATAWAVTLTGAKPVFVDCGADLNINCDLIEEKITERTKAIIPVHIYGRSCNMRRIMDIAYEYNLRVVEDSAEAHGVKPVGDIACFSLYANKIITAGEGGICVTNEERLANQMRHLRSMAFTPSHDFLHKKIAYNFRMTNMQGAVAKAQLERIDEMLEKRRKIEEYYNQGLKDVKGVTLLPKRNVLWMYDILVEKREELQKYLDAHGVESRQFFKPMSQQPMYYDPIWKDLKAAKYGYNGIYLPSYVDLTEDDQDYIIKIVKDFYERK